MLSKEAILKSLQNGEISTSELASYQSEGKITKSERRNILKQFKKLSTLSARQVQRREVKVKKSLPKLSKVDRYQKYVVGAIEEERKQHASNRTICLGCRKRGHFLKDCPNTQTNTLKEAEICFNCGSSDHPLRRCPHPRDGDKLPFAKCFVCKKTGHISKECPENANGLYPKGGCCHICFQKTHLVKDCPERTEEDKEKYRLLREAQKEKELGPKVKGLLLEESAGGDDVTDYSLEAVEEEVEEEVGTKRKGKGDKKKAKRIRN